MRSAIGSVSEGGLEVADRDPYPVCISACELGPATGKLVDFGGIGCLGVVVSGSGRERSGVSVIGMAGVSGRGI